MDRCPRCNSRINEIGYRCPFCGLCLRCDYAGEIFNERR